MVKELLALLILVITSAELVKVTIDGTVSLSWEYSSASSDSASFTITCAVSNWCAIGFGSSMFGTDMIEVSAADKEINDLYSSEHAPPPTDTSLGGKYSLENPKVTVSGSSVEATFTRKFNTGDKYDAVITPDSAFSLVFAYLDDGSDFGYHESGFGTGTLHFYSTQALSGFGDVSTGSDYDSDYTKHGKAMSSIWMALVPVGIIAARYFKGFQAWFYIHFLLMSVSTGVTVFSVSAIYKHNKSAYKDFDTDMRYHSRMGLTIGSIVLVQGLLGVLIRWFARKKETLGVLATLRWLHWISGWALFIVALIEIKYGWDMKDDDKLDFIYPLYGVLAGIFLVFELANRFGYRYFLSKRNLETFTYSQVLQEVSQGKEWGFFNDLVIDVRPFASSHPGGQVMFKHTFGQDYGKFIYGSSSWNTAPHIHSVNAHSLIAQLAVGRVTGPTVFSDDKPLLPMRLVAKGQFNHSTWKLTFRSEQVKVLGDLAGVDWIGKHFLVTYKGVSRYYSFVHCLGKDYATWHTEARRRGAEVLPLTPPIQISEGDQQAVENGSGLLTLVVKRYPNGKLTPYLTGAPIDSYIHIQGPFGPGLELNDTTSGDIVGFAGGTGLLPFLDLAHLLWKQTLGETTKLRDIRFFLHVSFSNKGESFALDLLRSLEAASPQKFKLIVNFTDAQNNAINEVLLSSLIHLNTLTKVAVCGPSGYNRFVEGLVEKAGVSRNKVVVL
mmetsp:Transcript_7687/g.14550  ORF Transcript_7687/g.14550 Transcript_7687/m.14550 type:complete len:722 (+) Transcript_7687:2043-4208(+)